MRVFLWRCLRLLPRTLQELPYRMGFHLLRAKFAKQIPHAKVGYRNSLDLHRIEPALSDLDITAVVDDEDRDAAIRVFRSAKRLIPFLGELNIYRRQNLFETRRLMNACEKSRDPIFRDHAQPTEAEVLVFLSRMLEADWTNLARIPYARQKKWRGHFDDVGWSRPHFITREFIVVSISSRLRRPNAAAVVEAFLSYKGPLNHLDLVDDPVVQTLFFHRICFQAPSSHLTSFDRELISEQARWEHWASQVVPDLAMEGWTLHENHIAHFLEQMHALE